MTEQYKINRMVRTVELYHQRHRITRSALAIIAVLFFMTFGFFDFQKASDSSFLKGEPLRAMYIIFGIWWITLSGLEIIPTMQFIVHGKVNKLVTYYRHSIIGFTMFYIFTTTFVLDVNNPIANILLFLIVLVSQWGLILSDRLTASDSDFELLFLFKE